MAPSSCSPEARQPIAPWADARNAVLLTDLYELRMLQAYWREGFSGEAVFSLFFRKLPDTRNFVLACGLDDALACLENLRFGPDALAYLREIGGFREDFLGWLEDFRFTGDVHAVPEGVPVFPEEPLLEVVAPIAEAQLAESGIMNCVHAQSVLASKATRVVHAAAGRGVVDFGMRRMHGADAALRGARAYYVAGIASTSNVLAGRVYGIPVSGTMAHSYIEAHDDEAEAFRAFMDLYPETVLLVDTYDTLDGIRKVVSLARRLGESFRVHGVRLDSGDLGPLARESRALLDEAGLEGVRIIASGGLDEFSIAELVADEAPIDAFGVGTRLGVSRDAPDLDLAYKLVSYDGRGRLKTSPGKGTRPGRKQIFRFEEQGRAARDLLAREHEEHPGRPLLEPVMRGGERLPAGRVPLEQARERARAEIATLPERLLALGRSEPYRVEVSDALHDYEDEVRKRVAR